MTGDEPSWVIDAHTHAFPSEWVADRSAHLRADLWFGELYKAPDARMVDATGLLAAMDAAGVDQAIMCGWPWADPGRCREHNDYLAAASGESQGRLAWLGTVAPGSMGAAAEAERCLGLGARGVGELNADAQGFDVASDGALLDIATVLEGAKRPLLLHASEPVGHRYPGKGTATPDRLLTFVANNPGLTLVLAHWGGGLPFYELMPEIAELTANVVYDSAASSYLYRSGVFRTVLDIVGEDRVLWGSDHPVLGMKTFLRKTRQGSMLGADEMQKVLGLNARRVYRLVDTGGSRL